MRSVCSGLNGGLAPARGRAPRPAGKGRSNGLSCLWKRSPARPVRSGRSGRAGRSGRSKWPAFPKDRACPSGRKPRSWNWPAVLPVPLLSCLLRISRPSRSPEASNASLLRSLRFRAEPPGCTRRGLAAAPTPMGRLPVLPLAACLAEEPVCLSCALSAVSSAKALCFSVLRGCWDMCAPENPTENPRK